MPVRNALNVKKSFPKLTLKQFGKTFIILVLILMLEMSHGKYVKMFYISITFYSIRILVKISSVHYEVMLKLLVIYF